MNSNFLASFFDWIGDALERFNPSAYRFLAAVLPYLTPVPVAWLTAASASEFLNLPPTVAFILVFALEGIGLWFTSLLVDAVVDWIKSRNVKTFALVLIFGAVVAIYVTILVNLNVTLEQAKNTDANPALSRVITLMCFLPLLTGVGNGYYKMKLDAKATTIEQIKYTREQEERDRIERRDERLEKYRIKHGVTNVRTNDENERTEMVTNGSTVRANSTNVRKPTTNAKRTNGELRTFVVETIEHSVRTSGAVPNVGDLARTVAKAKNGSDSIEGYERFKGYCSNLRTEWLDAHPQYKN